jgi:hypothetical protein
MLTPSNVESQDGTMKNVASGGSTSTGQQGGSTGNQQGGSSGQSGLSGNQ